MGFFEHSKKAGRFAALVIVLIIAGALSMIMAVNDPLTIEELVNKWLIVLSSILAYYLGSKQVEPS